MRLSDVVAQDSEDIMYNLIADGRAAIATIDNGASRALILIQQPKIGIVRFLNQSTMRDNIS